MAEVDWKCIRYSQKELCIRKRIGLDKFRKGWIRAFGEPQSENDRRFLQEGIKDFYEDYLTSDVPDLSSYFKSIVGHIT